MKSVLFITTISSTRPAVKTYTGLTSKYEIIYDGGSISQSSFTLPNFTGKNGDWLIALNVEGAEALALNNYETGLYYGIVNSVSNDDVSCSDVRSMFETEYVREAIDNNYADLFDYICNIYNKWIPEHYAGIPQIVQLPSERYSGKYMKPVVVTEPSTETIQELLLKSFNLYGVTTKYLSDTFLYEGLQDYEQILKLQLKNPYKNITVNLNSAYDFCNVEVNERPLTDGGPTAIIVARPYNDGGLWHNRGMNYGKSGWGGSGRIRTTSTKGPDGETLIMFDGRDAVCYGHRLNVNSKVKIHKFKIQFIAKKINGDYKLNAGIWQEGSGITHNKEPYPWVYREASVGDDLGNGFNQYSVEVETSEKAVRFYLFFQMDYPVGKAPNGSNTYLIGDVSVDDISEDSNTSSAGGSYTKSDRHYIYMKTDGTFTTNIDNENIIRPIKYKTYIYGDASAGALYDSKVEAVAAENLSIPEYSHEIKFKVNKYSEYASDFCRVGQLVTLYYGGRVYSSIVSGFTFDSEGNYFESRCGNVNSTLKSLFSEDKEGGGSGGGGYSGGGSGSSSSGDNASLATREQIKAMYDKRR